MNVVDRLQNTDISPKTAAISITVLALILTIIVWGIRSHVDTSTAPVTETVSSQSTPKVKVDVKESTVTKKTDNTKKPGDGWKIIEERNVFRPIPAYGTGAEATSRPPLGRNPMGGQLTPMPVGMLPGMPGAGGFGGRRGGGDNKNLAYTGTVRTPDGTFALIENTSTGETKYAREGDRVFNMEVVLVDDRSVSLDSDGQMIRLGIGENKTNLTANQAAPGTPPGGANQPGQVQQPGQNTQPGAPGASAMVFTGPGAGGNGRRGRRSGGMGSASQ